MIYTEHRDFYPCRVDIALFRSIAHHLRLSDFRVISTAGGNPAYYAIFGTDESYALFLNGKTQIGIQYVYQI